MIEQAQRIAGLSPAKLKLLARRLEKKRRRTELPQIQPDLIGRNQPFPLTEVQQAYWLGRENLFDLGGVSAHGYNEVEVESLDLERLNTALNRLIERHDMLRAVVREDGQQQILARVPEYRIAEQDLSTLEPEAAEASRLELREEMSHQVLDAKTWPLFDIRAARLGGERVRLHISFDILIADLTGYRILMRDLAKFYIDPEWRPEPLALSFRDYVLAHEALAESDLFQESLDYWAKRLGDLQKPPELPLAQDPSTLETPRFERRTAELDAEQWDRLRSRAARARLSSSGLLIAAFSEVLGRWSKDPRFTLTLTLFNPLPLHPQVGEIVGDFTSLALFAVDTTHPGTFTERARTVQEQLGRDLEHSQVGGVRVLREVARRNGSATTSLPVVFTSSLVDGGRKEESAPEVGGGILGETVYSISQTPQVWLDHQVFEQSGRLCFNWDAVQGLFPEGLLDDMFATYCAFLERLTNDESAWDEVPHLDLPPAQAERRLQANATEMPQPEGLLHQPFEAAAVRTPEALAVVDSRRRLNYGELDRRSAHLAHELRELGVERDTRVAVAMDKGWEQVVAVFGVLRAGGTYLPIAADLPDERIAGLFERGEITAVLTQEAHGERFAALTSVPCRILRDGEGDEAAQVPELATEPGDLAYIIFTSGSTGQPKGVMLDHLGPLNTNVDINRRFSIGPEDRVLGLSSLSFDLSVYDVFGMLAAGGTLVLPEPAAHRDPGRWAELLEAEGVTVWNTVPALMAMLVEDLESRDVPGPGALRVVMLSGDWLPVGLPDRIRALWPGVEVVSLGGATEASIWSILYPIGTVDPSWSSIPYGHAMDNQTFEVLNERFEPCPEWVPGQLHIGGIGLAKGYWRDGEQTDASFYPHPRTGELLYRTGDLGRWREDGEIEFLGREDFQVKVQGHRIELGEIETCLEQHPGVRAAVVDAVGDKQGPRSLAAWVVPMDAAAQAPASDSLTEVSGDGTLHPVDFERLAPWLTALTGRDLGGAFPKHRYPSAGDLYGVQAYLEVAPEGVPGLAAGLYYLHPERGVLARLRDGAPEGAPLRLYLVADRGAVEPVYPRWYETFLTLEAGYMEQLLLTESHSFGLAIRDGSPADISDSLGPEHHVLRCLEVGAISVGQASPFEGDEEELPQIATPAGFRVDHAITDKIEQLSFKLNRPGTRRDLGGRPAVRLTDSRPKAELDRLWRRRSSHRQFLGSVPEASTFSAWLRGLSVPPELQVFVQVHRDGVDGLDAAVYRLGEAGELQPSLAQPLDASHHGSVNREAFAAAGFSVLLIAPSATEEPLLAAGRWGQQAMETGTNFGIGLCPIGSFESDDLATELGFGDSATVLHGFVGGAIPGETVEAPLESNLVAELEAHLADHLPAYMVPSLFTLMERLPLSSNGKVDRKALPDPGEVPRAQGVSKDRPESPWEIFLAQAWEQILGAESVGVEDNFFSLGGDSVRAIQVLGRLRQIGVELSARDLFGANTLGQLAQVLEREVGPAPPSATLHHGIPHVGNGNGNGNGNGYAHAANGNGNGNGHAHVANGNGNGNGNGHAHAANGNGNGKGHAANGNGHAANGNGNGHAYEANGNGNGNGHGYANGNGNGNGHAYANGNGNGNGHAHHDGAWTADEAGLDADEYDDLLSEFDDFEGDDDVLN